MPVNDEIFELWKDRVTSVERGQIDDRRRLAVVEQVQAVKTATDEAIEVRLGKMESTLVWLTRSIIGAIVLAVIGFIVQQGGFGGL